MGLAEALDASCRKNGAASCSDRHRSADGFSAMGGKRPGPDGVWPVPAPGGKPASARRRLARRSADHDAPERARGSLDRHAIYIVAACVAGAAR